MHTLNSNLNTIVSKVPQVTLLFWIIKILATTLGETAGDAVSRRDDEPCPSLQENRDRR